MLKHIYTGSGMILLLAGCTSHVYATCTRDDIDHYLDRGFSPDQVTAICTQPGSTIPGNTGERPRTHDQKTPPSSPSSSLADTEQPGAENKTESFLEQAIRGRNITVTDNALIYTVKVCIEYGEEDLYGFAPKACPLVEYKISLQGLEILKSGKKYFFYGTEEIQVKGNITKSVISGLENLEPEKRQLILAKLEPEGKISIPLREDISPEKVKKVLTELAY